MKHYISKDGMCEKCNELTKTLIVEPEGCREYGTCNSEKELCLECIDKLFKEEQQ